MMKKIAVHLFYVSFVAIIIHASQSIKASEMCSDVPVSRGEILSGFQAGIVAGSLNAKVLPGGYYIGASVGEGRGFVIPENPTQPSQCENDHVLIGQWFGVGMQNRKQKEVLDFLSNGSSAPIINFYMKVDGNVIDHQQTAARSGVLEPFGRATFYVLGQVFEPFHFSPGIHTASAVFQLDLDCLDTGCDGIPDYDESYTSSFEVLGSHAPVP